MLLESFARKIKHPNIVENLRAGLIGERQKIEGPYGEKELIYADYTASGRALRQVEQFIAEQVLPFYANSHTETSYCGAFTTRLREEARDVISDHTNAGDNCSVIFTGAGATAAINRLVALTGIGEFGRAKTEPTSWFTRLLAGANHAAPLVLIGPYEHHSNILPWRESGADVIEIDESPEGGPDLAQLERVLQRNQARPLIIGAFSAGSNVTGILTDVDAVSRVLKRYNALSCWDYAGAGPYVTIDMNPGEDCEKDAVFLSPHKFPGGPGASGVLIVRHDIVRRQRPTWPGGGSVSYVSPWGHDYYDSLTEREEAGTPNILGDIRAALVFIVKAGVGVDYIQQKDAALVARAFSVWGQNPRIKILAADHKERLPIFSFRMQNAQGQYIHHEDVTRMLSEKYGIQSRGGCACAGPYGHRLLKVERALSEQIRSEIAAGNHREKPGWTRLNLCYLMDDETVDFIIKSVDELASGLFSDATTGLISEQTSDQTSDQTSLAVA